MRSSIIKALADDLGKPAEEAEVTEIIPVMSELRHIRRHLADWVKPLPVNRTLLHFTADAYVLYRPKGKVLILSPWNYPFNLVISPLASAIAAGNKVVIKPSEFTPATNSVIKDIVKKALPDDICTIEEGDAAFAAAITAQKWDHIFFTGSPAVGKKVMRAAAENLAPVTLELGGKSPCIVTKSADLRKAAQRIAWGKFTNCGQTCIAPDYLLIQDEVKDELMNLLLNEVSGRYPDACAGKMTDPGYGKIIHKNHFMRLEKLLDDALEKKAKLLIPHHKDRTVLHFSPAIVDVPSHYKSDDLLIMQEEIFGPILPVLSWKDENEVAEQIARHPKPLAAYVFSRKKKEIHFWRDSIRTGGFVANDVLSHFAHNNLPFGGNGSSGMGRSHGFFGFREFSVEMAVMESGLGPSGAELVGPPYTDIKRKIIKSALKLA